MRWCGAHPRDGTAQRVFSSAWSHSKRRPGQSLAPSSRRHSDSISAIVTCGSRTRPVISGALYREPIGRAKVRFMSTPTSAEKAAALDLAHFIDASPTPHFAARAITERLGRAGFTELSERDAWSVKPGDKRFV